MMATRKELSIRTDDYNKGDEILWLPNLLCRYFVSI